MLNPCAVNPKVSPLRSHSSDRSDALWAPNIRRHRFAYMGSVLPLRHKFAYCKRRLNAAETWQRGSYRSVRFLARYSFLHCRAGLDKARCKWIWYPAANFASGSGPRAGIIEPFKHSLRVTAHPQFLALELRAPVGACPGQYGLRKVCVVLSACITHPSQKPQNEVYLFQLHCLQLYSLLIWLVLTETLICFPWWGLRSLANRIYI